MSLRKEHKLAAKSVLEMQALLASIEKAERTITELKAELEQVNRTYQVRSSTQQDIDFLTALLKCAQKKLGWEKQVASIKKRAPVLMTDLTAILNDPKNPPNEASCASLLEGMKQIQVAVERLEKAGSS